MAFDDIMAKRIKVILVRWQEKQYFPNANYISMFTLKVDD